MVLYRIVRSAYVDDLSGTGARLYGGRWNSEGRPMVYLASSRSLAVLESLVHISPTNLPDDFYMIMIETPDDAIEVDNNLLPNNWQEYPEQNLLKKIGNDFLYEKKHLLLKVPSAIVQEEYNYLLNPLHKHFAAVKIISKQAFNFDERLF